MNTRRILTFILVILLLSIISILYNPHPTGNIANTETDYPKETAILERVIDGDTIVVTGDVIGNSTHIRMLGINNIEV